MSNIVSKLLTGKNPPEEIKLIERLNESKNLIFDKFNKTNIKKVKLVYNINILKDCLSVSEVLNYK